jgi:hypothetical protein
MSSNRWMNTLPRHSATLYRGVLCIIITWADKLCFFWLQILTYSMEKSPSWEANRLAASLEISRILWNPNVHYHIHKFTPPVSTEPAHLKFLPPHPTSWRTILILSPIYALVYSVVSFLQVSPPKPCTRLSPPHPSYIPYPSHSSRFYHPQNIGWEIQIMELLIMIWLPIEIKIK